MFYVKILIDLNKIVIDLRKLETAIDLRIGRRNENLKEGDRSEVHMHGNRTWIRGLDVDLILVYISTYINLHQNWQYHYSQITRYYMLHGEEGQVFHCLICINT
jgi:hypothetical protein